MRTDTNSKGRYKKPDIHLYLGVIDLLKELKTKDIKIGIITDGRPKGQRAKLSALHLHPFIDNFIITDKLGGSQFRKPCVISFRIILTLWRLNPEDVIYVGDNAEKDFQAPQQLGMRSLWFRNEDGLYQSQADLEKIDSLADLRGRL